MEGSIASLFFFRSVFFEGFSSSIVNAAVPVSPPSCIESIAELGTRTIVEFSLNHDLAIPLLSLPFPSSALHKESGKRSAKSNQKNRHSYSDRRIKNPVHTYVSFIILFTVKIISLKSSSSSPSLQKYRFPLGMSSEYMAAPFPLLARHSPLP